VTGDNELVSRKICTQVGIAADRVVLGAEIEKISGAELGELAERTRLFARATPAKKLRIIEALRARGHVVGFLGDGINDAPACMPPMSASRSTPPSTSRRKPPM
jgi:Mg2+-importing ATPase